MGNNIPDRLHKSLDIVFSGVRKTCSGCGEDAAAAARQEQEEQARKDDAYRAIDMSLTENNGHG